MHPVDRDIRQEILKALKIGYQQARVNADSIRHANRLMYPRHSKPPITRIHVTLRVEDADWLVAHLGKGL